MIGCSKPLVRIDSASSASSVSSKSRRGLSWLRCNWSMPNRRCSPSAGTRGSPGGASPIKEARPRPSRPLCRGIGIEGPQFLRVSDTDDLADVAVAMGRGDHGRDPRLSGAQALFPLDDLGGKADVGLAARAFIVIEQERLAKRRRLGHAYIARDHGLID